MIEKGEKNIQIVTKGKKRKTQEEKADRKPLGKAEEPAK